MWKLKVMNSNKILYTSSENLGSVSFITDVNDILSYWICSCV